MSGGLAGLSTGEWHRVKALGLSVSALPPLATVENRELRAMLEALQHAALAFAEDEVPVGAVVLDPKGEPVAYGRNRREAWSDPTAHAEIVAMRAAAQKLGDWRLTRHTMVVTLEPCPMCTGALINARIGRVIYGASDPKAGACGSVLDLHEAPYPINHQFPTYGGLLAGPCGAILQEYFRRKRALGKK